MLLTNLKAGRMFSVEWVCGYLVAAESALEALLEGVKFSAIAESTFANMLAAIAIAAAAWCVSRVRNFWLEKRLARAISPNGIGVKFDQANGVATFTLQVHNYANATILVRTVVFVADKFHIELRPSMDRGIHQTPLLNEILSSSFSRKIISVGRFDADSNPYAMVLPPKTMGFWEVDSSVIDEREWKIRKVYVVFEYATLFGSLALVRIELEDKFVEAIKKTFEPLSKAAHACKS